MSCKLEKSNHRKRRIDRSPYSRSRSNGDRRSRSTRSNSVGTADHLIKRKSRCNCQRPVVESVVNSEETMSMESYEDGPHIHPPTRPSMESSLCTEDVQSSPSTKSSRTSSSLSSELSSFDRTSSSRHRSRSSSHTSGGRQSRQTIDTSPTEHRSHDSSSSFLNPLKFSAIKHSYDYLKGLASLAQSLFESSISQNEQNSTSPKSLKHSIRSSSTQTINDPTALNVSSTTPLSCTTSKKSLTHLKKTRRVQSCQFPILLKRRHFCRPHSLQFRTGGAVKPNRWPLPTLQSGQVLCNRYLLIRTLGKGSFAFVMQAKDIQNRQYVAIKVFTKISHQVNAKSETDILLEIQKPDKRNQSHQNHHNHPSLVRLLQHFVIHDQWFLVFEYLSYNLYDYLYKTDFKPLSMICIAEIGAQMCSALAFLQDRNLIHTDIKPENVVFVQPPIYVRGRITLRSNAIKLIDMGLARHADDTGTGTVTTRFYRAPEVILRHDWSFEIDMWSVACTLFELYNGQPLFAYTRSNLEHIYMMTCVIGSFPVCMRYNRPDYFKVIDRRLRNCSSSNSYPKLETYRRNVSGDHDLFDLLHQMLRLDPQIRISPKLCMQHPFIRSHCKNIQFLQL